MPQNTCFRQNPWALLHSTRLCKMMELNNFHQIQFKFLHLSFQNVLNSFFQFSEQVWIRNKCGYEFNVVAKVYLLVLISILELETIWTVLESLIESLWIILQILTMHCISRWAGVFRRVLTGQSEALIVSELTNKRAGR